MHSRHRPEARAKASDRVRRLTITRPAAPYRLALLLGKPAPPTPSLLHCKLMVLAMLIIPKHPRSFHWLASEPLSQARRGLRSGDRPDNPARRSWTSGRPSPSYGSPPGKRPSTI